MVVGAGPTGALSALLLARLGVAVSLLESRPAVETRSHASTFHPSTLDLLASAGIRLSDDPEAVRVTSVQWRDREGSLRAQVEYAALEGMTRHPYRLHLDQQALLDRLALLLAGEPLVAVHPQTTVERLDAARSNVEAVSGDGRRRTFAADIVVGCDGADSLVRRQAGIGFPEADYPTGAIRAYVRGELMLPDGSPTAALSYFRDNGDGVSLLRMAGHTRLVARATGEQDDVERLHEAVANATPWNLDELELTGTDSYRLRRGVADSYLSVRGSVLVVGDAAHVTSTAGGLNMNSGIHDAFALMPVVADWLHGRRWRGEVEAMAAARRDFVLGEVIPRSERRVRGLQDADRDGMGEHLDEVDALAGDPQAARRFLAEASLLDSPVEAIPAGAR